jgi:hypothetical protein
MKNTYIIIGITFAVFFSSCNDETVKYYRKHASKLEMLAAIVKSDITITDVCCVNNKCFNKQALELMQAIELECLRKDTSDGTINFILGSQGKKLESKEIVFLYNRELREPKEYPKAGIYIKKIADNWFVREYQFD